MGYGCFLTHRSSRKNILGIYPIPNHTFEGVSMDLAENLRGKAERAIQLVKTTTKKILATAPSGSLNWEYIPITVSKVVN
jgi:hypothetical protein